MTKIVILDIETQQLIPQDRSLQELTVSFAGAQHGETVRIFAEHELQDLFALLDEATLIVGHNLLLFDYKVLQRYAGFDVAAKYREKTFDIFALLLQQTDRRVSLNDLAKRNLGVEKNGAGSDAPRLFQEGKYEELQRYLAQDLHITAQLFDHVVKHGRLKYGHITYKDAVERVAIIRAPIAIPHDSSA